MYHAEDVTAEISGHLAIAQNEGGVHVEDALLTEVADLPNHTNALLLTFSDGRTFRVRVDEIVVTATGYVHSRNT